MAHKIIWLPIEVFEELKNYAGMAQHENRIEIGQYCLMAERLVIDHVDKRLIVIKRHGKIIYEE